MIRSGLLDEERLHAVVRGLASRIYLSQFLFLNMTYVYDIQTCSSAFDAQLNIADDFRGMKTAPMYND